MAKLYSKPSSGKQTNKFNPKKKTVDQILAYSRAVKFCKYKKIQFETVLN